LISKISSARVAYCPNSSWTALKTSLSLNLLPRQQPLASLLEPVLEQAGDVLFVVDFEGLSRIVGCGPFEAVEEVFVVDDVAVFFVLAVESVTEDGRRWGACSRRDS
jgi:hypothetical protein